MFASFDDICMSGYATYSVFEIPAAFIVSHNDILPLVVLVVDVEVRQPRAVGNERRIDAIGAELVLLEWIALEVWEWRLSSDNAGSRYKQRRQ